MPAQPSEKKEKPEVATPKVEGFKISAEMRKSQDEIIDALATLSFLEIAKEGNYVAVLNVESRDIHKQPYLFSIIYLKPDVLEVAYTIVPGISPRKRRVDVINHLLNVLSLITDMYAVNQRELYQQMVNYLSDITEFATSNYREIYGKYDTLREDYEELKRRVERLEEQNSKLSRELIETKAKNDQLTLRVRQLEGYSDDALMAKIQDWLDVHRNQINISEFSKQYNVPESRVEDVLNKMVIRGYLELRA